MAIRRLLGSARAAVKHASALLGRVTHAANNCVLENVQEDGTVVQRTCRDSQSYSRQMETAMPKQPVCRRRRFS